ncbi:MAG TPA: hypothetical protein VMW95_08790 [Desulfobacterales bacterium]|nr:hypothetical protein [Desulfobacterales bacterium]
MSNGRKIIQDGYQPREQERGYQPQVDTPNEPKPESGYTPTVSGDTTTNSPKPPDEE